MIFSFIAYFCGDACMLDYGRRDIEDDEFLLGKNGKLGVKFFLGVCGLFCDLYLVNCDK
jgi:hypothetical protein